MSQPRPTDAAPQTPEPPDLVSASEELSEEAATADAIDPEVLDAPAEDATPEDATGEEPDKPPVRTLIDILRDQVLEKETQLHEYIQAYKAAKSDMGERIERLQRDREKVIDRDRKRIATDLLEVLDNLDRSITAMGAETDSQGVRMVHKQFLRVLTEFGVEPQEALGDRFDAKVHEAIGMIPASAVQEDQEVIHVDRAGYRYKGELLRPARVIVATKG